MTEDTSLILFEGMTSLRAVIEADKREIASVIYDTERAKKHPKEIAWLRHRSEEKGFIINYAEREKLDSLCNGKTHGGVAAYCKTLEIPYLTEDDICEGGFYCYLCGIEDPFNLGFALRSLYASGADGVILPEHDPMTAAGVVCRSAAGASERIPLFKLRADSDISLFSKKGYRVISAEQKNSVSLFECDLKRPLCVIIGGEKRGITRTVLELSDARVSIPYGRDFPQALSAASATAVIGFEVLRANTIN